MALECISDDCPCDARSYDSLISEFGSLELFTKAGREAYGEPKPTPPDAQK